MDGFEDVEIGIGCEALVNPTVEIVPAYPISVMPQKPIRSDRGNDPFIVATLVSGHSENRVTAVSPVLQLQAGTHVVIGIHPVIPVKVHDCTPSETIQSYDGISQDVCHVPPLARLVEPLGKGKPIRRFAIGIPRDVITVKPKGEAEGQVRRLRLCAGG